MAKLDRLWISGIRSFGSYEDDVQQLKFLSPLTLILGQNGCGKTTIIESIRYACTGSLPSGASSGQGFVNDPKMSGKTTTKGQIRLKIIDSNGGEFSVIRIMEVNTTFKGLKFSSKSPTIRYRTKDGEDRDIAGRCINVDERCCQMLNVSSAVLNYVIFCHQEHSAWPLEDSNTVKKRFDEIFDAQKYNKAVDLLLKTEKDTHQKIKILEEQRKGLSDKKDLVERDRRQLESKEEKLRSLEQEIHVKIENQKPIEQRLTEINDLESIIVELQREVNGKEGEHKGLLEQVNAIINNSSFKEFQGTDNELETLINNMKQNKDKDEIAVAELEKKKIKMDTQMKVVTDVVEELHGKIAKLQQEKVQYEKKCQERRLLFEKANAEMLKQSKDCSLDAEPYEIITQLKDVLEKTETFCGNLITKLEEEENQLQLTIDKIREQKITTTQDINSKNTEIRNCNKKIEEIVEDLNSLNVDDEILKKISETLDKTNLEIVELKNSFNEEKEMATLEEIKRLIQNQEKQLNILESEYAILGKNHVIESKIDSEKQSIKSKKQQIEIMKNKHCHNLTELFGEDIPQQDLQEAVEDLLNKNKIIVNDLVRQEQELQIKISSLETKKINQNKLIEAVTNELQNKEKTIAQICKNKSFTEIVDECYKKREKLQKDKGFYNSGKLIYEKFLDEFSQEVPCCPLCSTKFDKSKNVVEEIKRNIKAKIESIPDKLISVENDLRNEEKKYDKLQQLKSDYKEIEIIKSTKLPLLKNELKCFEENLNIDKAKLIPAKDKLEQQQNLLEMCQNIIPDIAILEQNQMDVDRSEKIIKNLSEQIEVVASKKARGVVEVEIQQLKKELSDNRKRESRITTKISNNKDKMQSLLEDQSTQLSRKIDLEKQINNKPILESQKVELETRVTQLKKDIDGAKIKLQTVETSLQNALKNKEKAMMVNKNRINDERKKISLYTSTLNNIEKVQLEIEFFSIDDIEKQLSSTGIELEKQKIQKQTLDQTKNRIIEFISEKKQEIASFELKSRQYQDNKHLREIRKRIEKLEKEINNLKHQYAGSNHRTLLSEKQQLVRRYDNLQKEIDTIGGQKSELIISIDQLKEELEKPNNKQVYKKYISKLCELKIAEQTEQDCKKYCKALETALLEFHEQRMREINKTIKEYWHDTYRGNDIDYIEIKSEKTPNQTSRKSYNYRVVQVKNGVELDMRGRCSAGQRVLACLIIRLAIAETLSANCGILALDEPTTNLDRENIQSLSDTLSRIVSARENQRNFQLIIITHDEEFLNTITRMRGVAYYYRVSRNDNGFSVIKKEHLL